MPALPSLPSLGPLRDAVEERLTLRQVGFTLVLAAALHLYLGASLVQVAAAAVTTAFVGFGDVVGDVYDVRESVTHGWNGAISFAGTGLLYALGEDPPLWFLAVFGTAGAWFLLDAVQTARHEGVTETEPDGREVYLDYVARRVHETLDERPRTRRELHDALDADDETVDAAVERLRERGVVAAAGSELRVEDADDGALARVGDKVSWFARRIARPVTLEFGDGSAEGRTASAESSTESRDERRVDQVGEAKRAATEPDSSRGSAGGREEDREPEPAN